MTDPVDPAVTNWLGLMLLAGGRSAEARRTYENAHARWPDSHFVAAGLIFACVRCHDWSAVDALLAPARLAQFPLREFEPLVLGFVSMMRDASPESQRQPIARVRERFQSTGYADFTELRAAAHVGDSDETHTIAAQAKFGPAGNDRDLMGSDAYRPNYLFDVAMPAIRRDPRFVKLCSRLGLVDYWLATRHWPDCADEVAPYYDFRAECEAVAAGPRLAPANEFAF